MADRPTASTEMVDLEQDQNQCINPYPYQWTPRQENLGQLLLREH